MLNKVESVQREIHKKITTLDKLWGLVGEAGVALGKFGKDAKPFVDRVREIAQITWRTQARVEELPSGTTLPLLTSGDPEECTDAQQPVEEQESVWDRFSSRLFSGRQRRLTE